MTTLYFQENIKEITRNPQLLGIINLIPKLRCEAEYSVFPAKNGAPTLVVKTPNNKIFTYHSKYNPQEEAKKQIEIPKDNWSHAIILGFGLGYAFEEIMRQLPTPPLLHQVIVIEPDPWVFYHAMNSRDLRSFVSDIRVDWCIGMTPDQIGELWNSCIDWTTLKNLVIVEHPPSLSRFPEYFERIKEKIRSVCSRSKGNLVTLMYGGSDFLTNNFLNLESIVHYPGVERLFNKFKGVPCIIVAAGPSLEKNVDLLKKVKDKFLIIAVDTAFRQLIARKIKPDIVCAGDPSYENSLDFIGVENETDVILAFEPMTHPDIPKLFLGPKLLMSFGGGVIPWLEKFREKVGHVGCWGSIATTAFDLARKFACDPIIFVGLDLSFMDGKLYASGSYSEDIFLDQIHPFTSIEQETLEYIMMRGIHRIVLKNGETVFTDQNMFLYKDWFEDQFRQTAQKVINATEGGCVEKYVEVIPLNQVIESYLPRAGQIRQTLQQAIVAPLRIQLPELCSEIRTVIKDIGLMLDRAKENLERCQKIAEEYSGQVVDELQNGAKTSMEDILKQHDLMCQKSLFFSWLMVYHAKFITRHTMEVVALKERKAKVGEWCEEMKSFFQVIIEFGQYILPLIEEGLRSIMQSKFETKYEILGNGG